MNDKTPTKRNTLPKAKTTTTATTSASHRSLNDRTMVVSHPTQMDVLCGQDKTFSQHPGNKLYRSVIAFWAEKYGQSTTKQSKMTMTTHICQIMKMQYRSRFLKPTTIPLSNSKSKTTTNLTEFRWTELTDVAARDKISHALRTCASAARRRQELRKSKIVHHRQQEQQQSGEGGKQQLPAQQHLQQQQLAPHLQQPMLPLNQLWAHPSHFPQRNTQPFASLSESPSDMWHTDGLTTSTDMHNLEPLPVSGPGSFYNSADVAVSASQLFIDNPEDEKINNLQQQRGLTRQFTEPQQPEQREPYFQRSLPKASAKFCGGDSSKNKGHL